MFVKKLIISLMVVCSATTMNAVNSIVVQNGSRMNVYSTIAAAVTAAQSGDTIYIGGATAVYAESITIAKPLTIFGAGWLSSTTAATQPTVISGTFTVSNGANNLTISGLQVQSIIFNNAQELTNVTISRCNVPGRIYGSTSSYFKMSNFKISECYLSGGTLFEYLKCTNNCNIEKNFIANAYINLVTGNSNYGCRFTNNIFFKNTNWPIGYYYTSSSYVYHTFIYQSTDCAFLNNIFVSNNINYNPPYVLYYLEVNSDRNLHYNNFYNCASGANFGSSDVVSNNVFQSSWTPTNIFNNYLNWNLTTGDFHVNDVSGLKTAGSDGLELGIYGSPNPFKDGFLPKNPHIESIGVSTETTSDGQITISAKVSGQSK